MSLSACRHRLLLQLTSHIDLINEGNEYLNSIKEAIGSSDLESMQAALDSNSFPMESIEGLELERHQLLVEFGFSPDQSGLEACLKWCDDDQHQVIKIYHTLLSALSHFQHSIRLNHLLIAKGKDRVQRSLGILTGAKSAYESETYSSSGQTSKSAKHRDIAVA